jgi:predicted nucleotidyltransferase
MLIKEWRKFKGWLVLEFFLRFDEEIHVKKLARELKISPLTASYYLKFYKNNKILKETKKGNLLLYSLQDNFLVRQLKRLYALDLLSEFVERFSKKNRITSLVLYGSHASGTYDKKSDIDLLVISQQKKLDLSEVKRLEREIGKEVKIQVFSIGEWKRLKKGKSNFIKSLLSNYILLYGAEI